MQVSPVEYTSNLYRLEENKKVGKIKFPIRKDAVKAFIFQQDLKKNASDIDQPTA